MTEDNSRTDDLKIGRDELSRVSQRAVDLALEYWDSLGKSKTYPNTSIEICAKLFRREWPRIGRGSQAFEDFRTIAQHSVASNGKYFGYIAGSGEPVGALGDFLTSVLNQNVVAWRTAPAAATIEKTVVSWLADAIGCSEFLGQLTGGASTSNLMGLAMAREAKLPANEMGAQPCVVYASAHVHMSVKKAAALLGLGTRNLRLIPVDKLHRMRMDALQSAISADRIHGRKPIAIVATAGTASFGAIDPLDKIARIANAEDLWLHIDAAYGGLAAIAVPQNFVGIDLADSMSLDPHKWLFQTVDCGCLLYRRPHDARTAFSTSNQNIEAEPIPENFNFFDESIELSRRARALKLWFALQYYGRNAFRNAIFNNLNHAQTLARKISSELDLELVAPVGLSTVCFRHKRIESQHLIETVNSAGSVFLSKLENEGVDAMRACFTNHRTTISDVHTIVSEINRAASQIQ